MLLECPGHCCKLIVGSWRVKLLIWPGLLRAQKRPALPSYCTEAQAEAPFRISARRSAAPVEATRRQEILAKRAGPEAERWCPKSESLLQQFCAFGSVSDIRTIPHPNLVSLSFGKSGIDSDRSAPPGVFNRAFGPTRSADRGPQESAKFCSSWKCGGSIRTTLFAGLRARILCKIIPSTPDTNTFYTDQSKELWLLRYRRKPKRKIEQTLNLDPIPPFLATTEEAASADVVDHNVAGSELKEAELNLTFPRFRAYKGLS